MKPPQTRFIEATVVDGVTVVRFLDLNSAVSSCKMDQINALADELSAVANQNPRAVVLDFEGQEFLPVAAWEGVLVRLHKQLCGRLSMSGLPVNVIEHFDTNRLSKLFTMHPNMDAAIEALNSTEQDHAEE